MDDDRKNFNGGFVFIDQSLAVAFTARQRAAQRSINTLQQTCWY
jgi:hypothetical protein